MSTMNKGRKGRRKEEREGQRERRKGKGRKRREKGRGRERGDEGRRRKLRRRWGGTKGREGGRQAGVEGEEKGKGHKGRQNVCLSQKLPQCGSQTLMLIQTPAGPPNQKTK